MDITPAKIRCNVLLLFSYCIIESIGREIMDDSKIIDLFWERSEVAIYETQKKYDSYCRSIAYRILRCNEDAEECVGDAYLGLWNSVPPSRPESLKNFLGCIVRRLALNRYDYNTAKKRGEGFGYEIIDEYFDCVPDSRFDSPVDELALKYAVNGFLAGLQKKQRIIFLRRYWYMCSVKEIADSMGITESDVKVTLHRVRTKFKKHLEKEGISL